MSEVVTRKDLELALEELKQNIFARLDELNASIEALNEQVDDIERSVRELQAQPTPCQLRAYQTNRFLFDSRPHTQRPYRVGSLIGPTVGYDD